MDMPIGRISADRGQRAARRATGCRANGRRPPPNRTYAADWHTYLNPLLPGVRG